MRDYNPCKNEPWATTKQGVFELGEDYYAKSGGIFMNSPHYEEMFH
jgi:hypothetical protein